MCKPITDKIHNKPVKSAHCMDLDLFHGPNPQSRQANTAVNGLILRICAGTNDGVTSNKCMQ
jgi:hypothetical protein